MNKYITLVTINIVVFVTLTFTKTWPSDQIRLLDENLNTIARGTETLYHQWQSWLFIFSGLTLLTLIIKGLIFFCDKEHQQQKAILLMSLKQIKQKEINFQRSTYNEIRESVQQWQDELTLKGKEIEADLQEMKKQKKMNNGLLSQKTRQQKQKKLINSYLQGNGLTNQKITSYIELLNNAKNHKNIK